MKKGEGVQNSKEMSALNAAQQPAMSHPYSTPAIDVSYPQYIDNVDSQWPTTSGLSRPSNANGLLNRSQGNGLHPLRAMRMAGQSHRLPRQASTSNLQRHAGMPPPTAPRYAPLMYYNGVLDSAPAYDRYAGTKRSSQSMLTASTGKRRKLRPTDGLYKMRPFYTNRDKFLQVYNNFKEELVQSDRQALDDLQTKAVESGFIWNTSSAKKQTVKATGSAFGNHDDQVDLTKQQPNASPSEKDSAPGGSTFTPPIIAFPSPSTNPPTNSTQAPPSSISLTPKQQVVGSNRYVAPLSTPELVGIVTPQDRPYIGRPAGPTAALSRPQDIPKPVQLSFQDTGDEHTEEREKPEGRTDKRRRGSQEDGPENGGTGLDAGVLGKRSTDPEETKTAEAGGQGQVGTKHAQSRARVSFADDTDGLAGTQGSPVRGLTVTQQHADGGKRSCADGEPQADANEQERSKRRKPLWQQTSEQDDDAAQEQSVKQGKPPLAQPLFGAPPSDSAQPAKANLFGGISQKEGGLVEQPSKAPAPQIADTTAAQPAAEQPSPKSIQPTTEAPTTLFPSHQKEPSSVIATNTFGGASSHSGTTKLSFGAKDSATLGSPNADAQQAEDIDEAQDNGENGGKKPPGIVFTAAGKRGPQSSAIKGSGDARGTLPKGTESGTDTVETEQEDGQVKKPFAPSSFTPLTTTAVTSFPPFSATHVQQLSKTPSNVSPAAAEPSSLFQLSQSPAQQGSTTTTAPAAVQPEQQASEGLGLKSSPFGQQTQGGSTPGGMPFTFGGGQTGDGGSKAGTSTVPAGAGLSAAFGSADHSSSGAGKSNGQNIAANPFGAAPGGEPKKHVLEMDMSVDNTPSASPQKGFNVEKRVNLFNSSTSNTFAPANQSSTTSMFGAPTTHQPFGSLSNTSQQSSPANTAPGLFQQSKPIVPNFAAAIGSAPAATAPAANPFASQSSPPLFGGQSNSFMKYADPPPFQGAPASANAPGTGLFGGGPTMTFSAGSTMTFGAQPQQRQNLFGGQQSGMQQGMQSTSMFGGGSSQQPQQPQANLFDSGVQFNFGQGKQGSGASFGGGAGFSFQGVGSTPSFGFQQSAPQQPFASSGLFGSGDGGAPSGGGFTMGAADSSGSKPRSRQHRKFRAKK